MLLVLLLRVLLPDSLLRNELVAVLASRWADAGRLVPMTADTPTPEQKELLLEDSEARAADRKAAPDSFVEHRTSDEATPPTE